MKTEQRIFVMSPAFYAYSKMEDRINEFLALGWKVVSVTAGHVSAASDVQAAYGGFVIVLERERV